MDLADWTDDDLAFQHRRQTAPGISTWGPGLCGHNARGSGVCADCLRAEIQRRIATGVGKTNPCDLTHPPGAKPDSRGRAAMTQDNDK